MKITNIRCVRYEGRQPITGRFYEERLVRPVDVHERFRTADRTNEGNLPVQQGDSLLVRGTFLYVDTDEGLGGLMGPIAPLPASIALSMTEQVIGEDPLGTQKIWDILYRSAVHGVKGQTMLAVSALDCALWDLKGKFYGAPVHRLLGGPTRGELPAYASMLGFPVDPEQVAPRVREHAEAGYRGQKWFFRHGPGSGRAGCEANKALVKAARESAGPDYPLMFDAWMSWDVAYFRDMAQEIEPYDVTWIEEPVLPDRIDQLAEIRALSPIPIAAGEHEYTRWGMHELLKRKAVDILQPDPMWAGGISEMVNICALASAYDIPVIPHSESVAATAHVVASQPPGVCPSVEYLVKWNSAWQFFLKDPIRPYDGFIIPDPRPGLGLVIDESKVEDQRELM